MCALHRIWCGAVYSSSLVSRLFSVRSAAGRHGGGRHSPPSPKGVTPATARTALFFTLPVRSCREGPKHFGSTLLDSLGSRRLGVLVPSRASPESSYRPAELSASCKLGDFRLFLLTRNQPVSSYKTAELTFSSVPANPGHSRADRSHALSSSP